VGGGLPLKWRQKNQGEHPAYNKGRKLNDYLRLFNRANYSYKGKFERGSRGAIAYVPDRV
jgi:hypothetical protein